MQERDREVLPVALVFVEHSSNLGFIGCRRYRLVVGRVRKVMQLSQEEAGFCHHREARLQHSSTVEWKLAHIGSVEWKSAHIGSGFHTEFHFTSNLQLDSLVADDLLPHISKVLPCLAVRQHLVRWP